MNDLSATPQTQRATRAVIKEDVHFGVEELFFSRTDTRGVIATGNTVFQRIAQFDWDRLLGAPHRIIRHPDMPRAVFWLLWKTIQAGQPVGAYVKNLAEDGRYYWVYAVVTPVDGGYLSVRLKPTSPMLEIIEKEYAALRAREIEENLEPADSAELLLARLKELGFSDYNAFMADALTAEFLSREKRCKRFPSDSIERYRFMLDATKQMLKAATEISCTYHSNRLVAMNMRVRAAHMGGAGKTIGEISREYGTHSRAMRDEIEVFASHVEKLAASVSRGAFLTATALLQQESIEVFANETDLPASIDKDVEIDFLTRQQANYQIQAKSEITTISNNMSSFVRRTEEMQRLISGLEVTRVMGLIECALLGSESTALLDVLDDLAHFQRKVSEVLSRIVDANTDVIGTIRLMT